MKSIILASALALAAPDPQPPMSLSDAAKELRRAAISLGYACHQAGLSLETCLSLREKSKDGEDVPRR